MKAVMLSVAPKWVDKICHEIGVQNGKPIYEKEDEVRKTRPNTPVPFKVYIYESRRRKKVVAEFICDRMTYIGARIDDNGERHLENTAFLKTGLSADSLFEYIYGEEKSKHNGWAWHISALKIYENPKELSEFNRPCDGNCQECKFALWRIYTFMLESKIAGCTQILTAPQSWCYVEEVET